MKNRILIFILALLVTLPLASCGGQIKSTDEEARIVGSCSGRDVRYDELRYITMTCKAEMEQKYEKSLFSAQSSVYLGEYAEELWEMVEEQICQNYASLIIFEKNGIKLNDKEIKKNVNEYVKYVIDTCGGEEEYKAYLSECYMTDYVCRFTNGLESAFEKYYEKVSEEYTKEAYDAVMEKRGFIRTLSIFIRNDKNDSVDQNRKDAEMVLEQIKGGRSLESFIGTRYNEDTGMCDYYFMEGYFDEAYEEAAFDLEIGEVSGVVETVDGFYIIERMPLEDEYFLDNVESLQGMYLVCKTYDIITEFADELEFRLNDYGKSLDLVGME